MLILAYGRGEWAVSQKPKLIRYLHPLPIFLLIFLAFLVGACFVWAKEENPGRFFPVICFKLPITGTTVKGKLFSISLEGSSYRKSTVDGCSHLCTHNNMLAQWRMVNQR